jgi:hypothetical protein
MPPVTICSSCRSGWIETRLRLAYNIIMAEFLHDFVLTFVPLFIVIDAFGNLPFLISAGQGLDRRQQRNQRRRQLEGVI